MFTFQTLQDSGYGGTDKRPGGSRPDGDAGDKENASPNRKVRNSKNLVIIIILIIVRLTDRELARPWPPSGPPPPRCPR